MKLNLPADTETRLAEHARAAGYDDVACFISEQLQAIAEQPTPEEMVPLTGSELADSLAVLRESDADIAAGRTEDLREALHGIADELGLKVDR